VGGADVLPASPGHRRPPARETYTAFDGTKRCKPLGFSTRTQYKFPWSGPSPARAEMIEVLDGVLDGITA
jgi:hypothetical protein